MSIVANIFTIIILLLFTTGRSAAQESLPSQGLLTAKQRWDRLSEVERDKLRKLFKEYKDLAPEEQQKLRERATQLSREMGRLEQKLSPADREVLGALGEELKDQWLKNAVIELIRTRHRGIISLASRERAEAALNAPPAERHRAMRELAAETLKEAIDKSLSMGLRSKVITQADHDRISQLPAREALIEVFEFKKKYILVLLERSAERRAELGDPDLAELKSLPANVFFERYEALRAASRAGRSRVESGGATVAMEGNPAGKNEKDDRKSTERRPGPPKHGDRDRPPFNEKFIKDLREKAKAALIKKGRSPEEAEKEISEAPPWKLMHELRGHHGRPPHSRPSPGKGD